MHAEYLEVAPATCAAIEPRAPRAAAWSPWARRWCAVSRRRPRGGRALQAYRGTTRIFIKPGFRFRAVDAMLTNFHLPESTLLMLCAAFVGRERLLAAYAHAVQARYRFFSYGDAMF